MALQMSTNDPAFWVMVMVAISFAVIAITMIVMAIVVGRLVRIVANVERRVEPLIERVATLAGQVSQIAVQGKDVAEQVTLMSSHLSTASMHFSESMALIRDEVREMKMLVGLSAETAREKVELISRSIDETHGKLVATTTLVNSKIVRPAREIAAIMAGVRRGLEVLVAPAPKPINQTYGEDEMFIG